MRVVLAIAFSLFSFGTVIAQEKPVEQKSLTPFVVATAALAGMAALDIEQSAYCIRKYDCGERNPLARPLFGTEGRTLPVYLAAAIGYGAVMRVAYRWRKQEKWYWWVAPATLTTIHISCSVRGLRIIHEESTR
ncbi:hypothetical protein KW796_00355 [Candidatus Parcubacteria bacterium]|nr:hypothetical protein [Candidatus Parcubacteria bacterium]